MILVGDHGYQRTEGWFEDDGQGSRTSDDKGQDEDAMNAKAASLNAEDDDVPVWFEPVKDIWILGTKAKVAALCDQDTTAVWDACFGVWVCLAPGREWRDFYDFAKLAKIEPIGYEGLGFWDHY